MRALPATALVVATAVALTGPQTFTEPPTTTTTPAAPSAAEVFATAATAVFAGTPLASDPALSPAQRAAAIPTDPAASWNIPTADGRRVELVLPGGLGPGEATPAGQVVYPDRGAGFEVLAENTGTGGRTITRIASAPEPVASGARRLPVVTMFVRTPADTALYARTDGALTVADTITPSGEPIAGIAPAAARDARGADVPSAFVTTQLKPGLYLLAQVIDPGPDTAFPVYADPCFSCWGNNAVDAVATVGEAAWSGIEAAGNFVKQNPVESVMIAGGTVLVATGVGSGFGVGLITAGATSLTQTTLQASDNPTLQTAGDLIEIGGYLNPTRSVLKGVDDLGAQLFKHTDDITSTVPVTPTNLAGPATKPAQLPAKPGVDTPQAPHAPPAAKTSDPSTPLATKPCAGQSFSPDTPVLLADGSSRPISQLRIGQQVLSSDPATGWTGAQPIQAVLVNHDTDLLDLSITNDLGAQAVIHTTAGHPFYRPATDTITLTAATTGATPPGTGSVGGWVDAGDLRVGDPLHTPGDLPHTPDTSGARVAATTGVPGTADMWDLTIATAHTFYIHTPTADILVHNCPTPEVPKTPKPEQPEGGVYVVRDANGNVAYTGRASNIDQRLYAHAGPDRHAKLQPGDTVQKYRTNDYAVQRGLEELKITEHRTLRSDDNPLGRNLVHGVGKGNPRAGAYEKAGKRYLDGLDEQPPITQLPERVQRRLDGQVRAQRSADAQRSTAQNSAREANQSGSQRGSDSGSQSGARSTGKRDRDNDKRDKKGSKKHHPRPNGK